MSDAQPATAAAAPALPVGAGLVIRDLHVDFGGLKAIDGLSLTVRPGEFIGVVGPNGAGKSTLIQTVTGFVRPSSGAILFNERSLNGRSPEVIAAWGIARTFQTSRVFPALSIGDSVRVGTQQAIIGGGRNPRRFGALAEPVAALFNRRRYAAAERDADERAEAVMRLFGDRLWPRRDRPAHSLSYANRRRLDIARALVGNPDMLLLDEPTAGMNPTESHELADLLLDLRQKYPQMAIVMIEHKLDIVRRLAGRTLVMGHGKAIFDDTPEIALSHPDVAAAYLGRSRSAAAGVNAGHIDYAPDGVDAGDASGLAPGPALGPALALKGVDVFYGAVQALFRVSLHVNKGEAVAVLGGNASGKSTAVKVALRLVKPRDGEVELFGTRLQSQGSAYVIEQGLASIPEGRRMFADLTVRDNLLMGAYARRDRSSKALSEDIARAIAEFPWLAGRLKQLAGTLSGGEQQMVAMARAWLRRPRMLCIDEPSMGLSPQMVERVYEILARWKSQGMTILMVEQSANYALDLVDRAYVLRNGVVVMEGLAADLKGNPAIQEAYLGAGNQAMRGATA
jgi:ABC-type branched-subunit amino acid transport system ATPase component